MAAPRFVPSTADRASHEPPARREGSWLANRPGEVVGREQPEGCWFGNQGPDQGYALRLARLLEPELVLGPGEHLEDVIAGCVEVALRRASLFGRGPVLDDVRVACAAFGYLGDAPDDLVAWRRRQFAELSHSHHYSGRREVAMTVPTTLLCGSPAATATEVKSNWRTALGVDQH